MSEPIIQDSAAIIQDSAESEGQSRIGKLSVRALIALLFSTTVCTMAVLGIAIPEELYYLTTSADMFFFGQKGKQ